MINVNDLNFALGRDHEEREIIADYWHQQRHKDHHHHHDPFNRSNLDTVQVQKSVSIGTEDSSLISLFAQSIEMFGTAVAPWPTARKSLSSVESGIFIKSVEDLTEQYDDIEMEQEQEQEKEKEQEPETKTTSLPPPSLLDPAIQIQPPQSFEPKQQSKLRRSNSSLRKLSLSRINAELASEARLIYENLQPIPIITPPAKSARSSHTSSPRDSNSDSSLSSPKERKSSAATSSRLQTFFSIFYKNNGQSQKMKFVDEQTSSSSSSLPADVFISQGSGGQIIKSILKASKAKKPAVVQKSSFIPVDEVQELSSTTTTTTTTTKPKKSMKLRFDNEVRVCETFHKEDYCRQSLEYVARQLTPSIALEIKKELNALKQEMEVHDDSRHYTQFYVIK